MLASLLELTTSPRDKRTALLEGIANKTAIVGVIGLGYVGLPLAVEKTKVGFTVRGYDRNQIRVGQVNQGFNYIRDVDDAELANAVYDGTLTANSDFSSLSDCDIIVICVPTPLTKNREPDLSYVRAVGELVGAQIRPGQLVCLESTTYPGTTEEVLLPLCTAGGLKVGEDFFLAFSPERVDPGNKRYTTANTNKVVGGVTPACVEVAGAFYRETILEVLSVSSPRVAEMTKVFENTFRAVNIALVNEMALLCQRLDIDIWEVIDAAATKPFGIMRFEPGPGVGGHCIPLDPFYLAWKAREYDFQVRFIELAGEINASMPYFVREKVQRSLNARAKTLKDANILVVGVAYKKDIEDWRESPSLKVIELLERDGAVVNYHDPHVANFDRDSTHAYHSVPLTSQNLSEADCVLILTDHSTVDWAFVVEHARAVVDTRNATRHVRAGASNVVML